MPPMTAAISSPPFPALVFAIALVACAPEPVAAPTDDAPPAKGAYWPVPYARVSDASVTWLKQQGWWPLSVGYFADVPGYSARVPTMRDLKLLEARGLEVTYTSFLSGPPILEAFLAGQTQVTHYGDFPFWNTVDKGVPAVAWGLTGTNVEAALVVAPDSPLQRAEDLGAQGRELVVGTTLGSYCEFYMAALRETRGIPAGSFRLAGMSMREAQLVPRGVDAVALFDPHVTFALEKGLGRRIDDAYPTYFATGYEFMRREIVEHAPDVAQAIADANVEALLAVRADPDAAAARYVADPKAKAWSKDAVRTQIERYVTLYKPTYMYLHPDFWSVEDARVVAAQHAAGRLTRARDAADLRRDFDSRLLATTYATLGWAVPPRPVFLPPDWAGEVGRPPYPAYDTARTRTAPQPWPEAGDLLPAP